MSATPLSIAPLNPRELQLLAETILKRIRNLESFAMSCEMSGSHGFARQHREEAGELKHLLNTAKERGLFFGAEVNAPAFV